MLFAGTQSFVPAQVRADSNKSKKDSVIMPHGRFGTGTVSHKFKSCGTVIFVYDKTRNDTNIVIPMGTKEGNWDADGNVISFRYVPLKIKNPRGCMMGGPIRMWDVKVVNREKADSLKMVK